MREFDTVSQLFCIIAVVLYIMGMLIVPKLKKPSEDQKKKVKYIFMGASVLFVILTLLRVIFVI